MYIISNPEEFRSNIVKHLESYFNGITKHASNLEKGIFNYAQDEAKRKQVIKRWDKKLFVEIYINHLRTILYNLERNNSLIQDVLNGSIKSQDIAFMTHQELDHQRWAKLLKQKEERDKVKFEDNISAATDTFTCRKCHQNKCSYYCMQTRSADEPCTIFVSCMLCGHRWKTY